MQLSKQGIAMIDVPPEEPTDDVRHTGHTGPVRSVGPPGRCKFSASSSPVDSSARSTQLIDVLRELRLI